MTRRWVEVLRVEEWPRWLWNGDLMSVDCLGALPRYPTVACIKYHSVVYRSSEDKRSHGERRAAWNQTF